MTDTTPAEKLREAAERAQEVTQHVADTAERIRNEREEAERQPTREEHRDLES